MDYVQLLTAMVPSIKSLPYIKKDASGYSPDWKRKFRLREEVGTLRKQIHYDILSPFILLPFFSIAEKEKEERNICYHRKDYILVKFYLHPPDGLVLGHELFISKAKG